MANLQKPVKNTAAVTIGGVKISGDLSTIQSMGLLGYSRNSRYGGYDESDVESWGRGVTTMEDGHQVTTYPDVTRKPKYRIPQGTNPTYAGGRLMPGGQGIATEVPSELQGQLGKYYATNVFDSENEGLLGRMGIRPEMIKQAKAGQMQAQQRPIDRETQDAEAYQVGIDTLVKTGTSSMKEFNELFKETRGETALNRIKGKEKEYAPQLKKFVMGGQVLDVDMNKPKELKAARDAGFTEYQELTDTSFQKDINFLKKEFNVNTKAAIRIRKSVEGQGREAAMMKAYDNTVGTHERKLKQAQQTGIVWDSLYEGKTPLPTGQRKSLDTFKGK